ncbi:MAG: addiction module toxin RelE [Muribaculaceae bacterium]|nr:addiction module toxin RelE [Muribaculaceae bacterium]
MNWTISTVPDFDREVKRLAKKYKSLRTDLIRFQEELKQNPFSGVEILPGVRKIRLAITAKGKGKSGGARIIYFIAVSDTESGDIILLYIYDKSESPNIQTDYLKTILNDLDLI